MDSYNTEVLLQSLSEFCFVTDGSLGGDVCSGGCKMCHGINQQRASFGALFKSFICQTLKSINTPTKFCRIWKSEIII